MLELRRAQLSRLSRRIAWLLATAPRATVVARPVPHRDPPHPLPTAQIDDRLNGDGTGLPFGVNDPTLGWVILGVAGLVWSLYYAAQRDFGNFEDDDSGLGL